jgi:hypothetical protein
VCALRYYTFRSGATYGRGGAKGVETIDFRTMRENWHPPVPYWGHTLAAVVSTTTWQRGALSPSVPMCVDPELILTAISGVSWYRHWTDARESKRDVVLKGSGDGILKTKLNSVVRLSEPLMNRVNVQKQPNLKLFHCSPANRKIPRPPGL